MNHEFVLPRRRRRLRPYLDLTAMIDTVFNLLIFFAVASTLVGARSALEVKLPSAQTATPVPERVVLTLAPDHQVRVNGRPVPSDQIGSALRQAAGGDSDAQVVVIADAGVPYAELVAALDQARLADFHRFALAATPERRAPPGAR